MPTNMPQQRLFRLDSYSSRGKAIQPAQVATSNTDTNSVFSG